MRHWLIWLAAVLAAGFLHLWPFPSRDTGELYIVETLLVEAEASGVRLSTGEIAGAGYTVAEAVADLEEHAPGQLFLRQTCRVIFCGGAEAFCDPLSLPEDLPVGVYLYRSDDKAEDMDTKWIGQVLAAKERREDLTTLAKMKNAIILGGSVEMARIERGIYAGA